MNSKAKQLTSPFTWQLDPILPQNQISCHRSKIWRPTGKKCTNIFDTVPSQKFTKEFCVPECSNNSVTYIHLLCVGWRNFFSSCAVVSVFGSGGKQVLVLHTYVCYLTIFFGTNIFPIVVEVLIKVFRASVQVILYEFSC